MTKHHILSRLVILAICTTLTPSWFIFGATAQDLLRESAARKVPDECVFGPLEEEETRIDGSTAGSRAERIRVSSPSVAFVEGAIHSGVIWSDKERLEAVTRLGILFPPVEQKEPIAYVALDTSVGIQVRVVDLVRTAGDSTLRLKFALLASERYSASGAQMREYATMPLRDEILGTGQPKVEFKEIPPTFWLARTATHFPPVSAPRPLDAGERAVEFMAVRTTADCGLQQPLNASYAPGTISIATPELPQVVRETWDGKRGIAFIALGKNDDGALPAVRSVVDSGDTRIVEYSVHTRPFSAECSPIRTTTPCTVVSFVPNGSKVIFKQLPTPLRDRDKAPLPID